MTVEEARFHRVLVAIDGSDEAELVISAAVTAARHSNGSLTLVTVVPDIVSDSISWPAAPLSPQRLQDEADREGTEIIKRAVEAIDLPVETVIRRGKPGPEIVEQASSGTYDAILIGARGRGRVKTLFGGVSNYVLQHAEVVVIVVRGPSPASD